MLVVVALAVSAAGIAYYADTPSESYHGGQTRKFYIIPTSWTFAIYDEDFNRVDRIKVSKGDLVILVVLPEPFVPKELHEEIEHEYLEEVTRTGSMTEEEFEKLHEEAEERIGRELYGVKFLPHGLAIEGYEGQVNIDLSSGYPAVAVFRADKAGEFDIYCSVFCGFGHAQMVVESGLVVEE
jgi:hypothetical protein